MIGIEWALYSVGITGVLALAAWSIERVLSRSTAPMRSIWAAGLALALLLPLGGAVSPTPTDEVSPVGLGAVEGVASAEASNTLGMEAPRVGIERMTALLGLPVSFLLSQAAAWVPADSWVRSGFLLAWLGSSGAVLLALVASHARLRRRASGWSRGSVTGAPVRVSRTFGPATVGIRRPEIVLPARVMGLPGPTRRLIVRHERSHVAAGDTRLLAAALLPVVAMPWNPLVWWMLRRLRDAVELDCDRRTLDEGRSAASYGRLLFEEGGRPTSRRLGLLAPTLAGRPSLLERRLVALRTRQGRPGRWGTGIVACAAILAVAVSCGTDVPVVGDTADDFRSGAVPEPTPGSASEPAPPPTPEPVPSPTPDPEPAPGVEPAPGPPGPAGSAPQPTTADDRDDPPGDLSSEPTFTPYTVAPVIQNRAWVAQALQREYPSSLRDAGVGGRILLYFLINEDGGLDDVQIAESSGFPQLDAAAIRVARVFEFVPALNGTEPTAVWIQVPVTFQPR